MVDGKIVFGLLGIKNVGAGAVDAILAEREASGPFASFVDFFERIDSHEVNRKVAESLIITGAFDRLGETRATLLHNLARVMEISAKSREARRYGQASLFEGAADAPAAASSWSASPSGRPPSAWSPRRRTSGSSSRGIRWIRGGSSSSAR